MSLDIRTTYLNFLLTASLGIALWYRGISADQPLGAFLLALSLVFLFEYGLVGMLNPDTSARLILASFVFSVFILVLVIRLLLPGRTAEFMALINVLTLLAFIFLIWGAFTASASDSVFDSNLCSWTMNGRPLFESISLPIFGLLFVTLLILSFLVESNLLLLVTILLFLGALLILFGFSLDCFGYYFVLLILFLLFVYYIVPFFNSSFSESMIRKHL